MGEGVGVGEVSTVHHRMPYGQVFHRRLCVCVCLHLHGTMRAQAGQSLNEELHWCDAQPYHHRRQQCSHLHLSVLGQSHEGTHRPCLFLDLHAMHGCRKATQQLRINYFRRSLVLLSCQSRCGLSPRSYFQPLS